MEQSVGPWLGGQPEKVTFPAWVRGGLAPMRHLVVPSGHGSQRVMRPPRLAALIRP